jgi:hypothetical protein
MGQRCLVTGKLPTVAGYSTTVALIIRTKTRWLESTSELYRLSYRRLSAKLVPIFADRGVPRGQRDGSLRPNSRLSRPGPLLFLPSSS